MMAPPFDISAEHAKCHGLNQRHLDHFRAEGVPPGALIKSAMGAWSMLARDRVIFSRGSFEFERHAHGGDAVGAFVWPAFSEVGEIADLCAWRPPSTVATWLGRVGLAGQELISASRFGEPLLVHADMLSWLRAGREGCVIVDPARAAPLLRQAGTLAVSTVAERRRLEAMLTLRAPRIEVVSSETTGRGQGTRTEPCTMYKKRSVLLRETLAPWTETTKRKLGEPGRPEKIRDETVDNIHGLQGDRPSGTSAEAGLRTLQKHATDLEVVR